MVEIQGQDGRKSVRWAPGAGDSQPAPDVNGMVLEETRSAGRIRGQDVADTPLSAITCSRQPFTMRTQRRCLLFKLSVHKLAARLAIMPPGEARDLQRRLSWLMTAHNVCGSEL